MIDLLASTPFGTLSPLVATAVLLLIHNLLPADPREENVWAVRPCGENPEA
jgi:hypothetical protein